MGVGGYVGVCGYVGMWVGVCLCVCVCAHTSSNFVFYLLCQGI